VARTGRNSRPDGPARVDRRLDVLV